MNSRVTIVIPVYNEEDNIKSVVESLLDYSNNLIIVNDQSTDNTLNILHELQSDYENKILIIENAKNMGIGYSVKQGFLRALEIENDIVIKFDGDNQHLAEDIPQFINKLIKEEFDFVKGNRFLNKEFSKPMPILKIIGNLITTNLQKLVSGNYSISDPNNGFLAIKKSKLQLIDFKHLKNNYYFENSLLISVSSLGLRISEIPIRTIYADEKSSIPIIRAGLTLIPTFIKFFYLRNILNAKFNLSVNAIVFFVFLILLILNLFINNQNIWIICIALFTIYLFIDVLNFSLNKNE